MKKGFTLIELLLVIAILGILIVMGIASYIPSLQKGRDSKRKNDLRQVSIALESYFTDKGRYPAGNASGTVGGANWGTVLTDGTTIYMTQLPQDTGGQQYYYVSDATGTYFQLYVRLENMKDSDIKSYSGPKCVGIDITSCNYGIASTNMSP